MREMILRTLLLSLGSISIGGAAPTLEPHLPQTIDCPNSDIHVFINQTTVDRSEYTFVDWNAANLQDCVEKCFGNHFCYSIRFDASLEKNCALYYFAAYNCSNQPLTKASTINYAGGSITLDCIRCPGRGDFVTAPPFSSIGEQTIVSETAVLSKGKNIKGTATEITHNSEHEGKAHTDVDGQENKDQLNSEATKSEEAVKEEGKSAVEGSGDAEAAATSVAGSEHAGEPTLTHDDAAAAPAAGAAGAAGGEGQSPTTAASVDEESAAAASAAAEEATTAAAGEAEQATTEAAAAASDEATTAATEEGLTTTAAESVEGEGEATTAAAAADESSSTASPPGIEPVETLEGSGEEKVEGSGEGPLSDAMGSATESTIEGSGVEGSGANPEISAQEEEPHEEAPKDDIETTTSGWNGHTETPRACHGNIRFVPSSYVDLDTVQLLINSTKANSPAECARICYEHNCGFAYYEPSTFECQFMSNTEDIVDTATCPTDFKDSKYQAEFRTDIASTMTCVVCAKDSEVNNSPALARPVPSPRRGSYPVCYISFQAEEGDHSAFPFYKSVQVQGLNECARHCFKGECSQSVYNPATNECRLGSNPKDTCNNLPIVHKFTAHSDEVLLQCFRCIPEDQITDKQAVTDATPYHLPAESIDEAAANQNKDESATAVPHGEATTVAGEESTVAPEESTTIAEEPATTASSEEPTTMTVTAGVDGVSVTGLPETTTTVVTEETTTAPGSTTLSAEDEALRRMDKDEKEHVIQDEATTSAAVQETTTPVPHEETTTPVAAEETTTPVVVDETTTPVVVEETTTPVAVEETTTSTTVEGSGAEVDVIEALPEGVTEAPVETTTEAVTTTTEPETTPLGGAEVELEEASGEATTAAAEETIIAGGELMREGSGEVEGSGVEGLHNKDESATSQSVADKAAAASADLGYDSSEVTTSAAEEEETTAATAAAADGEATTAASEEASTFEEAATTAATEEEASTVAGGEGEATTVAGEGATTAAPEEATASEAPGEMSKAIEANDQPLILASEDLDFGKSCVIKFQAAPFMSRPTTMTAPFEKAFLVDSLELCATRCFQDGCSGAKYEPESHTCHLSYDDKPVCDRSPLQLRFDVTGDTWIHCVNCYPEKSVVKDVLGAPLNKNATGEEKPEAEKSMLEKVVGAVSDIATPVAERVLGVTGKDNVLNHGCIVNFQATPSSEMPSESVEYLPPFKTRYAHRCATKCFQEGCAAATFNPSTNDCALGFGRFVKCSNGPLVKTALEAKDTILIHCMSCIHHKSGDGGVDLVVLSPDDARIHLSESQDIPAEEIETAEMPDHTGSPVEGSTASGAEETTAIGEESTSPSAEEAEATTAGGVEEATTAAADAEGRSSTAETSTEQPTIAPEGEVNGGSLGTDKGAAQFEGAGSGKVSEVPFEKDGVAFPPGLGIEAEKQAGAAGAGEGKTSVENGQATEAGASASVPADGTAAVAGGEESTTTSTGAESSTPTSGEEEVSTVGGVPEEGATAAEGEGNGGKFKVDLPNSFSIDSGATKENVDEKMVGAGEATTPSGEEIEGASSTPAGVEGSTSTGEEATTAAGEGEDTTASGIKSEGASSTPAGVEGSTAAGEEATTASGAEGETSTVAEGGEATTAATGAEGESSTADTSTEHPVITPAKELDSIPLHPAGSEVEVGSAESTTPSSGETTVKTEETTEEEAPAFVQGSEDEEAEEPKTDDIKHREGLIEKALSTVAPGQGPESSTASGASSSTAVSGEGEGSSTVSPVEGSTVATEKSTFGPGESSTSSGIEGWTIGSSEASSTAPVEGSTASPTDTAAANIDGAPAAMASGDKDHVAVAVSEKDGSAAVAVADKDQAAAVAVNKDGTASVAGDLEAVTGSPVAADDLKSKEGLLEKALATANPLQTTRGEVDASTAQSETSTINPETGLEILPSTTSAAVAESETAEPEVSSSNVSGSESGAPTSTVPSPAELAQLNHGEWGGAKFGQTGGQKGAVETGAVARDGQAETSTLSDGAASATSSEGAASSTSVEGLESSTSLAGAESSTASGSSTDSSTVTDSSADSSTASGSSTDSSTATDSSIDSSTASGSLAESSISEADREALIQKALTTGSALSTEHAELIASTVPSPADLAQRNHGEWGGAKFGQTGKRPGESSTEDDEIKASTIASVEASTANGESIDGGVDKALSALGDQSPSKTTTEPPVQAVKDLLEALASGDFDRALLRKATNATAAAAAERKTVLADGSTPIKQKHECNTGKLRFATFELVDLTTNFEADAVAYSLPHCARLCYEVGCTMAAYSRFPRPLCLMHFEKDEKPSHRCNSETNRTSFWSYSSLQEVVAIDCIVCEGQTFFEHDHNVDITTLHAIDDSIVTVPSPQGVSKDCDGGRLEFHFVPAGSLPRLNVTNDVPARTPADCARKCHETKGCTTAGFIPTPSAEIANGVCLLTSDPEVCISRDDAVPQHASVTAFVISCIRCTKCSYTLSHMTLSSSTAKFQHISTATTIGECAQTCSDKKCEFAQYDATTNTCALSMEATSDNGCRKVEPALAVKGAYPVRLECVQCRE